MKSGVLLLAGAMILSVIVPGSAMASNSKSLTVNAGDTVTAWEGVNMRGKVCIESVRESYQVWMINSGTNYERKNLVGSHCEKLTNKINAEMCLHNPNKHPITVTIVEDAKAAAPVQTIENVLGSAAGGKNSEVNKAHRAVKERLKKPFG